jgi:hypothetical protein
MNRESILNAFQEDPYWKWEFSEEGKNMSGGEDPIGIHVSIKDISCKDKEVSKEFLKLRAKIKETDHGDSLNVKLKTAISRSCFHKIFPEEGDVIRIDFPFWDTDLIFRITKIDPEIIYYDRTGCIEYDLRFTFQIEIDPYSEL